jgi:hypothetical protein
MEHKPEGEEQRKNKEDAGKRILKPIRQNV